MPKRPVRIAEVVERCAWCGTRLQAHMRVVIAGGRFAEWSSPIETLRGQVVRVRTSHAARSAKAIVPLPGTPAHAAGYELLFVLCSIACRDDLDVAIGDEAMIVSVDTPEPKPRVRRATDAKGRRASGPAPPSLLPRRPS